jgi:N-acetylmuramoyl-L-alanine amidase-like protein
VRFDAAVNRRNILTILAGGGSLAAGMRPSSAAEARIGRLIDDARAKSSISQRIDFISAALRGTRYLEFTLIGGPRRPEKFVARDDGFDCVTFCETVLAAAIAKNVGEFDSVLRKIRYHNGIVSWRERNHYFFEWGRHNIENGVCQAVAIPGSIEIQKSVYWHRELGHRVFSMTVIPRAALLANKPMLAPGDIIGFITQRPNLDYFHVGFIAFGSGGELLLRHASQSRRRVLDERMNNFVVANHVRYVTLLRPRSPSATAMLG